MIGDSNIPHSLVQVTLGLLCKAISPQLNENVIYIAWTILLKLWVSYALLFELDFFPVLRAVSTTVGGTGFIVGA